MPEWNAADRSMLARVDERTKAQDAWAIAHDKHDDQRFEQVFEYFGTRFDAIDKKLGNLWDEKNQRKGSNTALKLVTNVLYAVIALIAGYLGGAHAGNP